MPLLRTAILCMFALSFSTSLYAIDVASKHTFGAFSIGGVYSQIASENTGLNNAGEYQSKRGGVLFGLKRGMVFKEKYLLSLYIDGTAGREHKNGLFSLALGAQGGFRLFGGRLLTLIGGGFGVSNLATSLSEQYNIYGYHAKLELFIDIAKGYGLSIGYMYGFNYESKPTLPKRFDTSSIMLAFSFYDFNI